MFCDVRQVHVEDLRRELVEAVDEERDVVLVGAGVDGGDAADGGLRVGAAVVDLKAEVTFWPGRGPN